MLMSDLKFANINPHNFTKEFVIDLKPIQHQSFLREYGFDAR